MSSLLEERVKRITELMKKGKTPLFFDGVNWQEIREIEIMKIGRINRVKITFKNGDFVLIPENSFMARTVRWRQ